MRKKTKLSSSSEDLVEEREELMVCPPSENIVSLSEQTTTNTKSTKKERKRRKLSLSSSPEIEDLVEEREDFMVFPSRNIQRSSREKTHLVKPFVEGSEAMPPLRNLSDSSPPDLKALSLSVSLMGWRFLNRKFKSWARRMSELHEATWRKAGIFEAVAASAQKILKDSDLVVGIAEKWCPDTKTFVFPWGETTITLEDVMVLLGLSVLGSPVFATLDSSGEKIKAKLEKEWLIIKKDQDGIVTQAAWMRRFRDSGDELEHVAFLVLWLSYFVFPSRLYHLYEAVFPVAIHLSSGTRIALAPAVLAHLYAELSLLKKHISAFTESKFKANIDLTALFKLVQVWTWERFRELQPKPNQLLEEGQPRLARWDKVKQGNNDVRQILDNAKIDSFEWRPYTKTVKNWGFPKFYPEKSMWVPVDPNLDDEFISFARCIKVSKLVGIDSVEHYFPTRVASQFGMPQDVPAPVNGNNLSHKAAWTQYNKPIEDLTLFIPSRSTIPRVTPKFCEWWRKSFPQFEYSSKEKGAVESAKTLKPRNIIGHDTSNFVPSEDNMSRTSGVGIKISEYSTNKRQKCTKQARDKRRKYMNQVRKEAYKMKRTNEDGIKIANDSAKKRRQCMKRARDKRRKYLKQARDKARKYMKRVCENDDEEDDLPTIAQMVRLVKKKKYSDVKNNGGVASEPLGKKSRLEADNNGSGPPQKHASIRVDGDETVPLSEIEQRNEDTDGVGSKAGKNMVLIPIYENFTSDPFGFNEEFDIPPLSFDEEFEIIVSPLRKTSDEELDVYGSNVEKMTISDDGSKEQECVLHKNCAIAGEKTSSEKKDDDVVDDVSLIQTELASNPDNNEPHSCQKLASGGSKVPDELNSDIAVGDETQGYDCLFHDTPLESEEPMRSSEQLENLEKRNQDVGEGDVGDDSFEKSLQNLKVLVSSMEERIAKAEKNVERLKERKAMKQRELAADRLV